jgi:hypothetical protein
MVIEAIKSNSQKVGPVYSGGMASCACPRVLRCRSSGALQPLQDRARAHCDVELFRGAVATH